MDETIRKPAYVYILNDSKSFLDPYRAYRELNTLYNKNPKENAILHDFFDMEKAFERGEPIEMIHGYILKRLPIEY